MKYITYYLLGLLSSLALIAFFSFSITDYHSYRGEKKKKEHRIVFQLTTPDTLAYRALVRQLHNVLTEWPDARIEVVSHNKGIAMLEKKKSNVMPEITALKSKGVRFYACEFTLQQMNIPKTDIIPESDYVERGIVYIVSRQEEGWSYIKAGF